MTRFQFPIIGSYLNLISFQGRTFCAMSVAGSGLCVFSWPDGLPQYWQWEFGPDSRVTSAGFPRMAIVDGAVRILYARDSEIVAATVHGDGGWGERVLPWRSAHEGKWPLAWGANGLMVIQRPENGVYQLRSARWPNEPTADAGIGAAEGIAYIKASGEVVLTHINRASKPGMWEPKDIGGLTIGVGYTAGIATRNVTEWGMVIPREEAYEPHGCWFPGDWYTLGYHTVGSRGTTGTVILVGTKAEMLEARISPFPAARGIGVLWGNSDKYGYFAWPGNCEVLFEADALQSTTKLAIIKGGGVKNLEEARRYGTWVDAVVGVAGAAKPVFGYSENADGSYKSEMHAALSLSDVRLVQAYRNFGETVSAFEARVNAQLDRFPGFTKGIVAGFSPRNPPFQLTDDEVLEAINVYDNLLRRKDCVMLLAFDAARSGLLYHLEWLKWFSAIATTAGAALPIIVADKPPVESVVGAYGPESLKLLPGTLIPVNGGFAVKKPNGKYLCVTPDGNDEERDAVGSWETFRKSGNLLFADREKGNNGGKPNVTYTRVWSE